MRSKRLALLALLTLLLACATVRCQQGPGEEAEDLEEEPKGKPATAATGQRGKAAGAVGVAENEEEAEPLEDPDPLVDEAEQKKLDEALSKELKLVEQAQAQRQLNATAAKQLVVHAAIVPEAPQAVLWAGDADVATTGACEDDIERFCAKVEPGEGRLSRCLSAQMEAEAGGDAEADDTVSGECRQELASFKADRATNVNKDVPLALACRRDIRRHCRPKSLRNGPAAIMDCLRKKRKKLSRKCAGAVFEEEEEEAKDFRLNLQLAKACGQDAELLCADVDPEEEGAATECLIEKREYASVFCQEELERWEVQRADDVRLDRHLYHACSAELRSVCADVEPGDGLMEECLQDRREGGGFSARCRHAVEARMERQAADFQLNYGLREYCADDIEELCKEQAQQIAMAEGYGADSQVIACLETQRERITSKRCREGVHRQMEHEAEDIRFDHQLAKACHSDVKLFCAQVVPGSARVIHCLQDNRDRLAQACSSQLFDHEVMLAEDIDFKYPLRRSCVVEIDIFCARVPHGHARIVRCLQDNLEDGEMSVECREEVRRDQFASSIDYRLNYRLRKACTADVASLCKSAQQMCLGRQCLGQVLDCLREKQEELRGEECRHEVFKAMEMEAADFRNDHQTRQACEKDAERLCRGVEPGQGRMHRCLQSHLFDLSPKCRQRELRATILQSRDIRLQPALMAACSQEMAVYCEEVEPAKGRMQRCLAENMSKGGFSNECRLELSGRMGGAQVDYRLDYGLSTSCRVDVEALCKAEAAEQKPGGVLACLAAKFKLLAEPCQDELNRFVRLALWNYRKGGALTRQCDADVQARCPAAAKQQQRGMFRGGMVGKCLAKQVVQGHQLAGGCRTLVLVAAPRNVRAMFDRSMSLEAVAGKVAQIAHAAGLSAAFVDPKARGMHAITVTGWVAVACVCAMVLVVLGMLTFALWRWSCGVRRQHQYAAVGSYKQGDV